MSLAVAVPAPGELAPAAHVYVNVYGAVPSVPPAGVHDVPAPSRSGKATSSTPVPASVAFTARVALPPCAGLKNSVAPLACCDPAEAPSVQEPKVVTGPALSTTTLRVTGVVLPASSLTVSVRVYVPSGSVLVSQ